MMNEPQALPALRPLSRSLVLLLGLLAVLGLGCATINTPPPRDDRAAQFLAAAAQGDPLRQYQLATSYRYGSSGVARDPEQALRWMRAAAEAGHGDAQFALGDLYLRGDLGLRPDGDEALRWLRLAAAHSIGNRLWLANLLETGRPDVLAADPVAARVLYRSLAGQSSLACQRLGRMAEAGLGGPPDRVAALAWYLRARSDADSERLEKVLKRSEVERAHRAAAGEWP